MTVKILKYTVHRTQPHPKTIPNRTERAKQDEAGTETDRERERETRLKCLSVGYISESENIAGMCKKSCIKLVSTWVTRSGPGCCSLTDPSTPDLHPYPLPLPQQLLPLVGLIYFKTSHKTLEQHVRSTNFSRLFNSTTYSSSSPPRYPTLFVGVCS